MKGKKDGKKRKET